MIRNFEDLTVWQEAQVVAIFVYKVTKKFPKNELFGLTNQMRRASVSVGNNIAEGFGKRTTKDFIKFLHISLGSLFEIQSMFHLSKELGFISHEDYRLIIDKVLILQKRLKSFITKLHQNPR